MSLCRAWGVLRKMSKKCPLGHLTVNKMSFWTFKRQQNVLWDIFSIFWGGHPKPNTNTFFWHFKGFLENASQSGIEHHGTMLLTLPFQFFRTIFPRFWSGNQIMARAAIQPIGGRVVVSCLRRGPARRSPWEPPNMPIGFSFHGGWFVF